MGIVNVNIGERLYQGEYPVSKSPSHGMEDQTLFLEDMYSKLPPIDNRELTDKDLRSYFYLALLICKADYPDFEIYASVGADLSSY